MEASRREYAQNARGFLPPDEGDVLYQAACDLSVEGPLLEVGSYCGKSAVYLGTAAEEQGRVLYALDHHRGSEENQAGWEHHEPDLIDVEVGRLDTLPIFRKVIHNAGLEHVVVAIVGDSVSVAKHWNTSLAFLFIDGGHGLQPARNDYSWWVPKVKLGGVLAIHDVFPDTKDGGRPPYECIYLPAIQSGDWVEERVQGSLRILRRTS
ncbi:MAG: hypothetical protein CL457_02850 [Acidimicrobiaceae bacterium]|nr:hypothetical protein [Acidimicrobiaceae bacterium]|tara:strand:- start:2937 stop:3560 length:624 start_codon:yes stop_codon:yes gene_type:complete